MALCLWDNPWEYSSIPFRAHLTNDDFRRLLMTPRAQDPAESADNPPKRQPVEKTPDVRKAKKKRWEMNVCL